jgi:hypothetical protein
MADYIVVQLGAKHKPNGPYWTGHNWSSFDHCQVYKDEHTAIEQAVIAVKTACRDVAVLQGNTLIVFRRKPAQRGQAVHYGNSYFDKKV